MTPLGFITIALGLSYAVAQNSSVVLVQKRAMTVRKPHKVPALLQLQTSSNASIVDGQLAIFGDPALWWAVALVACPQNMQRNAANCLPFCTGTLISNFHVLTAWHCIEAHDSAIADLGTNGPGFVAVAVATSTQEVNVIQYDWERMDATTQEREDDVVVLILRQPQAKPRGATTEFRLVSFSFQASSERQLLEYGFGNIDPNTKNDKNAIDKTKNPSKRFRSAQLEPFDVACVNTYLELAGSRQNLRKLCAGRQFDPANVATPDPRDYFQSNDLDRCLCSKTIGPRPQRTILGAGDSGGPYVEYRSDSGLYIQLGILQGRFGNPNADDPNSGFVNLHLNVEWYRDFICRFCMSQERADCWACLEGGPARVDLYPNQRIEVRDGYIPRANANYINLNQAAASNTNYFNQRLALVAQRRWGTKASVAKTLNASGQNDSNVSGQGDWNFTIPDADYIVQQNDGATTRGAFVEQILESTAVWLRAGARLDEASACVICGSGCGENSPQCGCCVKIYQDGGFVPLSGPNSSKVWLGGAGQQISVEYFIGSEALFDSDLASDVAKMPFQSAQSRSNYAQNLRDQGVYSETQMASIDSDRLVAGSFASPDESFMIKGRADQQRAAAQETLATERRGDLASNKEKIAEREAMMAEQRQKAIEAREKAEREVMALEMEQKELASKGKEELEQDVAAQQAKLQSRIDELRLNIIDLDTRATKLAATSLEVSGGYASGVSLSTRELILKNGIFSGVVMSQDIDSTLLGQVVEFKALYQQLHEPELSSEVQLHPETESHEVVMESLRASDMENANRIISTMGASSFQTKQSRASVGLAGGVPGVLALGMGGGISSSSAEGSASQSSAESTSSFSNKSKSFFKSQYLMEPRVLISVPKEMVQPTPSFRRAIVALKVDIDSISPPVKLDEVTFNPPGSPCTSSGDCTCGWCNAENNRCYESCFNTTGDVFGNNVPRYATYWCNYTATGPPKPELRCENPWTTTVSKKSGPGVNAATTATCPDTLAITGCNCYSPGGKCNAARVEGGKCVAYNGQLGVGVYAQAICASAPSAGWDEVVSALSAAEDDTSATATCPENSFITSCTCLSTSQACDGSYVSGNSCKAFNSAHANGVKAVARCGKLFRASFTYPSSEGNVQPSQSVSVTCEEGSVLTGCSCHEPHNECGGTLVSGSTCTAYSTSGGQGVKAYAICGRFLDDAQIQTNVRIRSLFTRYGTHICPKTLLGAWWRLDASVVSSEETATNDLAKVASSALYSSKSKGIAGNYGGSASFEAEGMPVAIASDYAIGSGSASEEQKEASAAAAFKLAQAYARSEVNVLQSWRGGTSGVSVENWRWSLDDARNSNWRAIDRYVSSCIGIWNFVDDEDLSLKLCSVWMASYRKEWPVGLDELAKFACNSSGAEQLFRHVVDRVQHEQRAAAEAANEKACIERPGMHWDTSIKRCSKNICRCGGLAGAAGADCLVHGAEKCNITQLAKCSSMAVCPAGYSLNPAVGDSYCASRTCSPQKEADIAACCFDDRLTSNFKVTVKTKDQSNCGATRVNVYVQLFGSNGLRTGKDKMDSPGGGDFKQGKTSDFSISASTPFIPSQVCLTLEKGNRLARDRWCPQSVIVGNADTSTEIGGAYGWPMFNMGTSTCRSIMRST